jgi:hypothetical protein
MPTRFMAPLPVGEPILVYMESSGVEDDMQEI